MVRKLLLITSLLVANVTWLDGQHTEMLVTVLNEKTLEPILDLGTQNFLVVDDKTNLRVTGVNYIEGFIDAILLVDASVIGAAVQPMVTAFVEELGERKRMALVTYHTSADLVQEFTSSRQLLLDALRGVRYQNQPRVMDALYAALDEGFQKSVGRRVIVVFSTGMEGRSHSPIWEVLELARQRNVSIFPVCVKGSNKGLFRRLAHNSGGAFFVQRELKVDAQSLSRSIHSVLRGYYILKLQGVYRLGNQTNVRVRGLPRQKGKIWVAKLPLE